MLSSIGRNAVRRIGAGQSHASASRVGESILHVQRVGISLSPSDATEVHSRPDARFVHSFRRTYATASKTASSPRAKRATPSSKPATKTKSSQGPAKKAAAKPKAKPKKKKTVAKPKTRVKKVLTEAQVAKRAELKAKAAIKELKASALLSPPKALPQTAWMAYLSEQFKDGSSQGRDRVSRISLEASTKYKNLNPSDREHYNHVANQNKLANEKSYRDWVESHTPEQIRAANSARNLLKRKLGKKGSRRYSPIDDTRSPKRAVTAMLQFMNSRWASGDMKGIAVPDAGKALHIEWNALPAAEKKQFEDLAAADRARYAQEYKAVFHRDLPSRQRAAVAA